MNYPLPKRLKRLRQTAAARGLVQETRLHYSQLVMPLFISERISAKAPIKSMPGLFQLTLDDLQAEIEDISQLKIPAVLLFGIPEIKDEKGSEAFSENGIIPGAIRKIREINPDLLIISDLCFCEYTSHGHCGILKDNLIDNDRTLELLGKQAVVHAQAGADWLAPSSMTDGMVIAIREALDNAGYQDKAILSYAVKYSSSFYGPFREATEGAPKFGDRKTYQMNPANAAEAIREARLDLDEGADILMVKPAMNYLDVIYRMKETFTEIPLCAYQVSGEYAMIKAASDYGMQEDALMMESLLAIKRAGADFIISYFAKEAARLLQDA